MPATNILRRVNKQEGTGCLEWLGMKNDRGYGLIKVRGKQVKAHRLAYELFMGEIPEDKEIHHVCGNKACINPKHMEVVDKNEHLEEHRGENLWLVNADKTHCINGHEYTPENTYRRPNGHRDCRICMIERVKRWRERHLGTGGSVVALTPEVKPIEDKFEEYTYDPDPTDARTDAEKRSYEERQARRTKEEPLRAIKQTQNETRTYAKLDELIRKKEVAQKGGRGVEVQLEGI